MLGKPDFSKSALLCWGSLYLNLDSYFGYSFIYECNSPNFKHVMWLYNGFVYNVYALWKKYALVFANENRESCYMQSFCGIWHQQIIT